jgi:hypothetical protein
MLPGLFFENVAYLPVSASGLLIRGRSTQIHGAKENGRQEGKSHAATGSLLTILRM